MKKLLMFVLLPLALIGCTLDLTSNLDYQFSNQAFVDDIATGWLLNLDNPTLCASKSPEAIYCLPMLRDERIFGVWETGTGSTIHIYEDDEGTHANIVTDKDDVFTQLQYLHPHAYILASSNEDVLVTIDVLSTDTMELTLSNDKVLLLERSSQ